MVIENIIYHILIIEFEPSQMRLGLKISTTKKAKYYKYYKCDRCGYISTVRNTSCPICVKDGHEIRLK